VGEIPQCGGRNHRHWSFVIGEGPGTGNREQGTGDEGRGMRVGGRGNCQNGRRRPMAGNRGSGLVACGSSLAACKIRDSPRARRRPRRIIDPGKMNAHVCSEAASSRLSAAPAAYSPDLLGRGRHAGAIFFPVSSVSPFPAGFRGGVRNPAAEARWKRAQEQRDSEDGGCRPVFLGLTLQRYGIAWP